MKKRFWLPITYTGLYQEALTTRVQSKTLIVQLFLTIVLKRTVVGFFGTLWVARGTQSTTS